MHVVLRGQDVLRGLVRSATDEPLERARIDFAGPGVVAGTAYTGAAGRFLIPLPLGLRASLSISFGDDRLSVGGVAAGDDLGVLRMDLTHAVRVRLIGPDGTPIERYRVGFSGMSEWPPPATLVQHDDGVCALRTGRLTAGERLFFEWHGGSMVLNVPRDVEGGGAPLAVVAQPAATGSLTIHADPGLPLPPGGFALNVEELRQGHRRSENRRYVTMQPPQDGAWRLDDLAVGSYECRLTVGVTVVACAYVTVSPGASSVELRTPSK